MTLGAPNLLVLQYDRPMRTAKHVLGLIILTKQEHFLGPVLYWQLCAER